MGIAVDKIVYIAFYTQTLKTLAEIIGGALAAVMGDDHAPHHEAASHEGLPQTKHVLVVSDTEIGADLVLHDILCANHNDNLDLVAELGEHPQLRIGLEAGQHAAGMVVVKQFTAKFQIQLTAEFFDTFPDVLRLNPDILLIVKALPHLINL